MYILGIDVADSAVFYTSLMLIEAKGLKEFRVIESHSFKTSKAIDCKFMIDELIADIKTRYKEVVIVEEKFVKLA